MNVPDPIYVVCIVVLVITAIAFFASTCCPDRIFTAAIAQEDDVDEY
jgi:hypothetical protein